ncbi:MAG: complex I subunit 5 family protein [Lachnospiraceae bacterium]
MGLHFTIDSFRLLQVLLSIYMWLVALIFAVPFFRKTEQEGFRRKRVYIVTLLTLLATVLVFLSADFYTLFLFFEWMSLLSFLWVIQDESTQALHAGKVYLAVGILGGLVMLMGIFLNYALPGQHPYAVAACLLFGFGSKAGILFLHVWMAGAYTQSPSPVSALFSGMLSKIGVFGIIMISTMILPGDKTWGLLILSLGAATMLAGAFLAIFQVNFKRMLAYSSMSQIGFILIGIGMYTMLIHESEALWNGIVLYMANHSICKLIFFLIAAILGMNLESLDIDSIRGFGRHKKGLHICYALSALGISGIPFFSGYISKTLLHESLLEGMAAFPEIAVYLKVIEILFLLSGGCTLAYMLKFYVVIFWEQPKEERKTYWSLPCAVSLILTACVIPVVGILCIFRNSMFLTWESLSGACISIIFGLLLYGILIRHGIRDRHVSLKYANLADTIYEPVFMKILPAVFGFFCRILDSLADTIVVFLRKTIFADKALPIELEMGNHVTYYLGMLVDKLILCYCRIMKKERIQKSYVHEFAVWYEKVNENNRIIARSLSFGLLAFTLGLIATVLYLMMF